MPKVGKKHFAYTPEGLKEAEAHAAKTGQKVENMKRYQVGGLVSKSGGRPQRVKTRGTGAATRGLYHYTVPGSKIE
tara:strand:- start:341 stop:568 length:228 start_codon:yes stop_codon:yes gene_type:complete